MKKYFIVAAILIINVCAFSQDEKKMSKYLAVFADNTFNSKSTISFDRKDPHKNGWEEFSSTFENAFVSRGFEIVLSTDERKSDYIVVIDYKYGYSISMYRMQCSDLTGQIIDVSNQNKVVGTFKYDGRFEIPNVADAIAKILSEKKGEDAEGESQTSTPINTKTGHDKTKTKEEKLVELKQFYEKQLISREEYEEQKKKVLEE